MRQYRNTLNDLLSRAFTAATVQTMVTQALNNLSFPSDDDTQFSRADSTVVRQHMYAYFEIADRISNQATASANYSTLVTAFINLDRGTCTSINTSALSSACATRFIENFGRRSLRRPLSATTENNETASYLAIYNNAGGNAAGIGAVMFKFLMAPNFLYQIENDGTLVSGRLHRLSSYALASRLSYLFWNSMPDEQLLTYAATMNLSDNTNYTTVLNYVANSPRSADSMREFMNEWLHLKSIPQFSTNNPSLNFLANGLTLDSALRTAMIQEVEELGAYALQNNLSLQDLFTTDISFARDSRLMSIYGVSTAAAATVTPQNATRFPAGQRSGLLTRAALLTGGSELANPIKRGLKVRKDVMCLEIQSPPAELEDALEPPAVNVNFSTRQRYDHATSAPTCMNCHQYINSIGHAFSAYNSFGKYWTQEPTFNETGAFSGNYVPVNSQVDLTISLGSGLSADNANQFSQLVSNHRNTKQCFSEKMLRFAEARPIDKSKEGCRLNDMYSQLNEARSLKDFLRTLANAEEFRHRVIAN